MLFHTWVFLAFFLIVYPVYLAVRKNNRLMNLWLMIASYTFYGWWNPNYLLLLFGTSAPVCLPSLFLSAGDWTMTKRPARPPGVPTLLPSLTVKDADAAVDFYQRAFGFEKHMSIPGPDGRTAHAEVKWQEAIMMLSPEGMRGCPTKAPATSGVAPPVGLYLYCDDVDAMFARATAAGAKAVMPPATMFWGDRMCNLTDPDGHSWSFATNVADFDPSQMPK